nr:hypothetical protein [Tanacetum cinerariifolium]
MVNTRTDADLSVAVQNALQTLLPQIRAEIREEFCTSFGPSNSSGNPPPVTIHTWLERFNKQKPCSFEKATAPVDVENWISHMEKIFDVILMNLYDYVIPQLPMFYKFCKFHYNFCSRTTISTVSFYERRSSVAAIRHSTMASTSDEDDPHDDAHPKRKNSAKQQKTSEYEAYVFGESSSGHDNEKEQGPSTLAKLKKIADEMLRQRCTSGDEHQYHIDQMKNFLKSDIVWESRKEILVSPYLRKTTPLVQSCHRDLEAPVLSLINQDLLYLKKGSSRPEKIVLSLHKFPAIVARRANECILLITKLDFKNLNKNEIKDMYLLIMNGKVPDYAETWLLWSLLVFIRRIKKHEMFSIIYKHVHEIIYKNSKKEKRVMRHSEIHKFCDATLNRVLEGLKSYNNDVKYGYIQKDLTKDKAEYLKLFEDEIKVRLKYHRKMRRWEMYVNGRLLGLRRERPE